MGSPTYGYKHVLLSYIEYGERETNWGFRFSEDEWDKMFQKPEKELEERALKYYPNNYSKAVLNLGYCIKDFVEEYHSYCDMMNAFAASMSMLFDLFKIKEEDERNLRIPWPDDDCMPVNLYFKNIEKAKQCLADNGIEVDETDTVLQALFDILIKEDVSI